MIWTIVIGAILAMLSPLLQRIGERLLEWLRGLFDDAAAELGTATVYGSNEVAATALLDKAIAINRDRGGVGSRLRGRFLKWAKKRVETHGLGPLTATEVKDAATLADVATKHKEK